MGIYGSLRQNDTVQPALELAFLCFRAVGVVTDSTRRVQDVPLGAGSLAEEAT